VPPREAVSSVIAAVLCRVLELPLGQALTPALHAGLQPVLGQCAGDQCCRVGTTQGLAQRAPKGKAGTRLIGDRPACACARAVVAYAC
jgi:hypothetical protein